MATVTRGSLIADTRQYMDAQTENRWSNALIRSVLNSVYDREWSRILNAAPYYTYASRSVTTDANGVVPWSALSSGTGDSQQNFYRILSVTDGSVVFAETRFQDVPLGLTTNYSRYYDRLYYLVGTNVQTLPAGANQALTIGVNWKPTAISDLAGDDSVVAFPDNNHMVIVWEAAHQLLLKGGTEAAPAAQLRQLADMGRAKMLDDLRRRTIQPTRMAYPDTRSDWAGG